MSYNHFKTVQDSWNLRYRSLSGQFSHSVVSNSLWSHGLQYGRLPSLQKCETFVVIQPLSRGWLFATPWTAACQAFLSFTIFWSLLKLLSIELMMLSDHLILCYPLLLLPSIFPSIRVFSNEAALHIRWPKYWSFSLASVLPMNIQDWFPLGWTSYQSQMQNPLCVSEKC